MIVPLLVVLFSALFILALIVSERFPPHTWRGYLHELVSEVTNRPEPVTIVPQDARLEDILAGR